MTDSVEFAAVDFAPLHAPLAVQEETLVGVQAKVVLAPAPIFRGVAERLSVGAGIATLLAEQLAFVPP